MISDFENRVCTECNVALHLAQAAKTYIRCDTLAVSIDESDERYRCSPNVRGKPRERRKQLVSDSV